MPLVKCKAESLDLTANYTFTGDVSITGGGALNLISTQTASSSSSISFTTGIDSTYDEYWFIFNNIHPSANEQFQFQASTDSGSNYNTSMTSTNFRAYHFESDAGQALQSRSLDSEEGQSNDTDFGTIGYIGSGSDENASGILKLYNPSSTTYVKHFICIGDFLSSGGFLETRFNAGYFNTTSAVDAVQFKMSSGNIDAGTIQLFGVSQ